MTLKKKKEIDLIEYKKYTIFSKELTENIGYLEDVIKSKDGVFKNVRKTSALGNRTKEYEKIIKDLRLRTKDLQKDLELYNVHEFLRRGILIYLGIEDLRNDIIFSLQNFDEKRNKIDYSSLYELEMFH